MKILSLSELSGWLAISVLLRLVKEIVSLNNRAAQLGKNHGETRDLSWYFPQVEIATRGGLLK